ncbi:Alpha/Beta hydrolase protein [Microdochium trichocladiopsis]|uniref:Alpha/Beta hydrolase protein n=1 Tax=Microdochium trichocladiopsis TaxID=1682393 RepID=A0A9P9BN13_9PEZI|nr:Alpha/Beta hydrolase protein [Microdochium trichocladiopsis]KAH7030781.1 Alpha/Beta hydrolase protein [Microdochium trichocladiopsis]
MDMKVPLTTAGSGVVLPQSHSHRRLHYPVKLLLVVLLGAFGLAWIWLQGGNTQCTGGRPVGTPQRWYAGESLPWHSCGQVGRHTVECSSLDVPMDHFGTAESKHKTFTIPLIRLRGHPQARNLLLNPGGPGGSGIEFLFRKGEQLREVVGDDFHLLSFDPRGVNASIPAAHCYPDAETEGRLSSVQAKWVLGPDNNPELYAWSTNFGRACVDTLGEHGEYINTPQTAADMNSILDAVGQQHMYYWGFSYGTLLGQTYATLFPERSHRVIIDGVANQFDWFNRPLDAETVEDTEAVLDGFLDECVKAGDSCSLSAIAKTKQGLWDKLIAFGNELQAQPLSIYVNSTTWGTLDWTKLFHDAIFPVLYRPADWPALAGNLTELLQGNATDFLLHYAMGGRFPRLDQSFFVVYFNDGASGLKRWPEGYQALDDILVPFYNGTMFRSTNTKVYFLKQQWPVPRTHRYVPRTGVKTAHPLLLLTTTYDPVCPMVSAKNTSASFIDSKIIEVKGYGHCSLAVPSKCMANHVRDFLYNGTLPEAEHTQCERDGEYFPRDGDVPALSLTEEDARLHAAQVQLAQDWDLARWW